MKVLITGGAGYLGSTLVEFLLTKKEIDQVTVVDNLMYGQTILLNHCKDPRFKFIHKDVNNSIQMCEIIDEECPDFIIPLACIVGMPLCKEHSYNVMDTNYSAVLNLSENGKNKIIYPTTNSGYGVSKISDGELIECTEETELNPISLYGISKVRTENELKSTGNAVCLRLATVFGPSQRMRTDLLVNDFVYKAMTDKFIVLFESHFKRNYIHVVDVARTMFFAMMNFDKMSGQSFNVGLSSANLSKKELCNKIKEQINFQIIENEIAKDPDQRNYIVSNDKLENLGWRPKITLETGIEELIRAYQILIPNDRAFRNY